jgi:glycosyltransferase involved in cell wall biosynthesis
LQSALNQTLQPLEIIVADDCSTDDTLKVIEKFNHPSVSVIKLSKNSGAQKARNEGIKVAKGEWIAFLDSDDEWLPLYLQTQLELAKKTDASVVYCEAFTYDGEVKNKYEMADYSLNTFRNVLTKPGPMFQGLLVKKKCLETIHLLDEDVVAYQEWDTCIRLAKRYNFAYNPEPLFIYHLHQGVTISKHRKNEVKGYSYIVHKHQADILKVAGESAYLNHLKIIQLKYYNQKDWSNWKATSEEILKFKNSNFLSILFKSLILQISPNYYQRFQDVVTPVFILKRWYYLLLNYFKKSK